MPNRRIKVLTPTGFELLEITPEGVVLTNSNSGTTAALAGRGDLFIQEANPGMTRRGLWFELRPNGTFKTAWIETGS